MLTAGILASGAALVAAATGVVDGFYTQTLVVGGGFMVFATCWEARKAARGGRR